MTIHMLFVVSFSAALAEIGAAFACAQIGDSRA